MLVLVDEPQVDFLVKITGAHGGDAARAFTLRRDEAGQWTEREAFDDVDALPHLAEVDLSHPDRISIVVRTDREYRLEAERRQGQLFTGNETSDLGRSPFTVLALDRAGAEKVPLPVDDREHAYLIVRPDRVTALRRREAGPRGHALQWLESAGCSLGWELPWEDGGEGDPRACAMFRSFWAEMDLIAHENPMSFAHLWPVNGYWLGVETRDGKCHPVWVTPDPLSLAGGPGT